MKIAIITENVRSLTDKSIDLKQDVFNKLHIVTYVPLLLEQLALIFLTVLSPTSERVK